MNKNLGLNIPWKIVMVFGLSLLTAGALLLHLNIAVCFLISLLYLVLFVISEEATIKFYFFAYLVLADVAENFYIPLGNQSINFVGIVNFLVIITLVLKLLTNAWQRHLIKLIPVKSFYFFVFMILLTIPFSQNALLSLRGANRLFSAFSFLFLAYIAGINSKKSESILKFVIAIFFIILLYGPVEYITGFNIMKQLNISSYLYQNFEKIGEIKRVSVTFGHPSTFAFAILTFLSVIMYRFINRKSLMGFIFLLLMLFNLILTFTRISWIAAFLQLGLFLILLKKCSFIRSVSIILPLAIIIFPLIFKRLTTLDSSVGLRFELLRYGFGLYKSHFIFGIGLENFLEISRLHFGQKIASHGDYMRILAETGLVGGFVYSTIIFLNLKFIMRHLWKNDYAKISLLTWIGFLIFAITDNALSYSHIFWGLQGLLYAGIIREATNIKQ